jgi:hypothetical protein
MTILTADNYVKPLVKLSICASGPFVAMHAAEMSSCDVPHDSLRAFLPYIQTWLRALRSKNTQIGNQIHYTLGNCMSLTMSTINRFQNVQVRNLVHCTLLYVLHLTCHAFHPG